VSEKRHLQYSVTLLLGVSLLATYMSGPSHLTDAVRRTVGFRGPGVEAAQEEAQFDGNTRTARAILDLVSDEGDPLLVWTNAPWPYLIFERVSATRFIWKSFVLGEIYLGARSPAYVLPQTWEWFVEDLAESRPVVAAEVDATLESGTPFADHLELSFTEVYSGTPTTVYLGNDIVSSVLSPTNVGPWSAPSGPSSPTGWEHSGSEARYRTGANDRVVDLLPLATSCKSVTGDLSWSPGEETGVAFIFDDTSGANERLHIGIERQRVFSASEFVVYEEEPLPGDDQVRFTLVIGARSAALVIGGQIVTALRLPPSVNVSVQARATEVMLANLTIGVAPPGSGCN
jgi:hypothetical protein